MLVGRVVIADDMAVFSGGPCAVDHLQEFQPLPMTMFLPAQAQNLAIGCIERGTQGGCAVAFVVVRHGLAAAFIERQAGLCAIRRLYLTLLIDG